ncbi:hypothetical protein UNDYM_5629 [Undibacterium sp. YM2]|uniref:hypothetical protein n=1 Tax=Undibacterium sp. YM2 TaxID=2058625 RepID=UPI001331CCB9|nr:hypothetical protein [Undibacterium sp. YM2]BBB69882.1 hypothetical protein UNDYM_5629 [Undibacterium sp. YM2]
MKNTINNTFKSGLILSTALLTGALAITAAFTQGKAEASMNIASVTISAKRMTEEQKMAYDATQNAMQTVLISAKRMTDEEKLAMDEAEKFQRQQVAQKAARKNIQG